MTTNGNLKPHKMAARIFGVFFLISFLAYGIGAALFESLASAPDMLATVSANKTLFVVAAILMAVIHTFTNIGLPVTLLRVLKPRNETLYVGYLSAAIVATIMLAVGVVALLVLLPLSDVYMSRGSVAGGQLETTAMLLRKANNVAYQIGMIVWSLGGLMFCAILYQSKLVPRAMSVWGGVGYIVFATGCILALFGLSLREMHVVPGAVFEVGLSLWLIVKGFSASATVPEPARTERTADAVSLSAA